MRVLIAGSGAREHALAWACTWQNSDVELICAPGNGGTAMMPRATNVAVAADDPAGIVRAARELDIGLVVIGPDAALAAGVADACMAAGIAVFGPTAAAARIESSKIFAKTVMDAAGIPTARWRSGGARDRERLLALVDELDGRCVVKADGLALGKGVIVCDGVDEAHAAIAACLDEQRFGAAGSQVLIEERLEGAEVSVLALTDSRNIRVLPAARDYKRIGEGDTGPNTGGMGALSPPAGVDQRLMEQVEREVLRPCIDELAEMGSPFAGCLYAGLMLTTDGLRVLEFNARFGDPETQVVLPLLSDDVLALLCDCAAGRVTPGFAQAAEPSRAVGVVLAAAGYPGVPRKGDVITGLDRLDPSILAFHAGTRREADDSLRTDGGRVLTLVARGASVHEARDRVYAALPGVHFEGMQHRGDIGLNQAGDR
jgi:phosphoribosylamine--glycine ligase